MADLDMLAKARHYVADGRVRVLRRAGSDAECVVLGTMPQPYGVVLASGTWACSCPAGVNRRLCSHVVACALVLGHCQAGHPELHRFDRWLSARAR